MLVIEDKHGISQVFLDIGRQVERHSPKVVNTECTAHISDSIKSNLFSAIIAEFPVAGYHVVASQHHAVFGQLSEWARQCSSSKMPFVIIGPFGSKWREAQISALFNTQILFVAHHRMCHFGLHVDSSCKQPSSCCFVTGSTFKMANHRCTCNATREDHVDDYNVPQPSSSHLSKHKALVSLSRHIFFEEFSGIGLPPGLEGQLGSATPTAKVSKCVSFLGSTPDTSTDAVFNAVLEKYSTDSVFNAVLEKYSLQHAYPTEGRERQKIADKARREAGIEKNRKKFVIEEVYDDCGRDLSGLGPDAVAQAADYYILFDADLDFSTIPDDSHADGLEIFWLLGSDAPSDLHPQLSQTHMATTLQEAVHLLDSAGPGDDIAEICGGESRVSTICMRRHLKIGGNFDLVTQCDLNSPEGQAQLWAYLQKHKPLVVVMAPTCKPFGPRARLNKVINYETWLRSYKEAAPHGRLCGQVARYQDQSGRYFVNEQPHPSTLYEEPPWPTVAARPTTVSCVVHQCMTGLLGPNGGPAKKPTGIVANHPLLLHYIRRYVCDGSHEHDHLYGPAASRAQIWTWTFAKAIADGVCSLCSHIRNPSTSAFPAISTGPDTAGAEPGEDEQDNADDDQSWRKCPGCRGRMSKEDPAHNRTPGVCKHPLVEPIVYDCKGCRKRQPEGSFAHNYIPGECKFTSKPGRGTSTKRRGKHPRSPATSATGVPATDLQAQLPGGKDLGEDDEAAAALAEASVPAAAADAGIIDPSQPSSSSAGQAGAASSSSRGPDQQERVRRTFAEASSGSGQANDWTRFDIRASLRALKSDNPAVITRELRKLHLRWWHAGITSMTTILRAAGIHSNVLSRISEVIKNCRECRVWAASGNTTIPTLSLPDQFNQHVEVDLMFYRTFIVFHMIDRCTRWHAGLIIDNKEEATLLDALHVCWISIFGAMQKLYSDGESGMTSGNSKQHFIRQGIELKIRAPEQHARHIERYGAILRVCMHVTEEQCKREGIAITIKMLLAQCLFMGNSLTSVGSATPYQAVMGRQPQMLPPLADSSAPSTSDTQNTGDSADGRREARIREIAINSMVQASAMARVSRALGAKTSGSTASLYKPGDLVDFHRRGGRKDDPNWHGPVEVVRDSPSDGNVILKIGGRELPYRYQDLRHTLLVLHSFFTGLIDNPSGASKLVREYIENLKVGTAEVYGMIADRNGTLVPTKATRANPTIAAAIEFTMRNNLLIEACVAVRIAHGVSRLGKFSAATSSLIVWWHPSDRGNVILEESGPDTVIMHDVVGNRAGSACVMQILLHDKDEHHLANAINQEASQALDDPDDDDDHDGYSEGSLNSGVLGSLPTDLSAITEEDQQEQNIWHTFGTFFTGERDPAYYEALVALDNDQSAEEFFTEVQPVIPPYVDPEHDVIPTPIQMYHQYVSAGADVTKYAEPHSVDDHGNAYIELGFSRGMAKCMIDDEHMQDDEVAVMQVYLNGSKNKKTVIERDTDNLTADEFVEHKPAVDAAILEELRVWVKYSTFERWPRQGSQNIMTSRFVAKWKWIDNADGKRQRIIRMRMTIRGFQDWYAHLEENYSPTASRVSQRIVSSEAACHPDWIFVTIDIEKAFLQGLTYKEIQAETGEPERHVLFSLPKGSAAVLRQIPGFEDFDERYECLRCIKPGTGTKGAPRAFSMKLSAVTRGPKANMHPTTYDHELEVRHDHGKLTAISAKHVDDIKIGGEPYVIKTHIIPALEEVFGKLKYNETKFTNTGVRHERHADGSVTLDQDEYISALKPISHPSMIGAKADAEAGQTLIELFWSLLGAAAYMLITQSQLAVYIVSLQRKVKAPLMIHIRRLNAVVRVAQKRPAKIVYQAMQAAGVLECHSDSGFSKEQEAGYGIRGANYMRHGWSRKTNKLIFHLLDAQCRSHKHVTRCSFSSETRAAVVSADELMPMAMTLHEITFGVLTANEARSMRDQGHCRISTILTVDSMSLWSAIAAITVRIPTEKNLAVHMFWLKQLLTIKAIRILRWCDTRDMNADCHTKGSIDRACILRLMLGEFEFVHPVKDYEVYNKANH